MFFKEKELSSLLSYINIMIRMFLCTPASNCLQKGNFNSKKGETYLRLSICNDRHNSLAILNIECRLTSWLCRRYPYIATQQAKKNNYNFVTFKYTNIIRILYDI